MSSELRFDDRVVIVTGAGNGLGRCHAQLFGSRGAKVVVNDLGGNTSGGGRGSEAADRVVAEIIEGGGQAVANYDSVEDGDRIVQTAMDTWGRVDVVVNNAGILRDKSFHKMSEEDWDLIYRVHVLGSMRVTKAAWPHLREAGYGRVIMTSSAAGIYGNFGQANYAMAKLGLAGFSNTLAIEGSKRGIHVNAIAPVAASRMTEGVLPPNFLEAMSPETVSPLVAWLCHESCDETGGLFEIGGGFVGKLRWERTTGRTWRVGREITPEMMHASWKTIVDFSSSSHPHDVQTTLMPIIDNIHAGPSRGGNQYIDCDEALGFELPSAETSYTEHDLSIYALGVGAAADPLLDTDLQLVYEMHRGGFRALPTYGVVPAVNVILAQAKAGIKAPGLNYGLERLLHGEQYTELKRPLPKSATLTHKARISEIYDKGKNAIVVTEVNSYDEDGDLLIVNKISSVVRGIGGWGGDRGSSEPINVAPDRAPDATVSEAIAPNQALLYRLSGDWNPLHADPRMVKAFGFDKPILHGLCTFGFAGRHVLNSFCEGDTRYFKSIQVRFADPVYPGETLVTEMWKESDTRILFRCRVAERDKVVMKNAAIELYREIPEKKKTAPAAAAAEAEAEAAPAEAEGPRSSHVFIAIADHLELNPGLAASVGKVFEFRLTDPDSVWTVDLKVSGGKVMAGRGGHKADCVLELSDENFVGMSTGEKDAQKMFFGGELSISGDVMASQQLEFLQEIDPERATAAVAEFVAAGRSFEAGDDRPAREAAAPVVMARLTERLADNPALASEVGAVVQLVVGDPDSRWALDLTGAGAVTEGESADAAATLRLMDEDLGAWASGERTAQDLFQRGLLHIEGDVSVAHRLGFLKGLA